MKKLLIFPLILLLLALSACSLAAGAPRDGQYTIGVTLTGGTGRAAVESPAKLTAENGEMTALIVWSSPHYDFMIVDGQKYLPISKGGNAAFEIPVSQLDTELPVSAETTAMSQPHVIDYTLRFDSSALKAEGGDGTTVTIAISAAVAVAAIVLAVVLVRRKKKYKTENES